MTNRMKITPESRKVSSEPPSKGHVPTVEYPRLTIAEVQKVEEVLKLLRAKMKSFLSVVEFDASGFEVYAESFQDTLDQFHFLTDENTEAGVDLKEQYLFTKGMFHLMLYSAELSSLYRNDQNYSSRLLCKVLDLNVRILDMFNMYGDPDINAEGFGDRVLSFNLSLYFWRASFEILRNVSLDTRLIFEQQFEQAETIIECLTTFMLKTQF